MDKPIIKHCKNCEWASELIWGYVDCTVKYKRVNEDNQRHTALFCRFFNPKEGENNG